MNLIDVSMQIDKHMQVYKNKQLKKPVFEISANHDEHGVYETNISLNLHTGTHMDFSLHMIKNGKDSTNFDIKKLIRKVKVLDLTHVIDGIGKEDLTAFEIETDDFLLLKTKNSYEDVFNFEFIYLKESASHYLSQLKIAGVGIDALGIERDQKGYPTHHIFFKHDMIIIEGLRLKEAKERKYMMIALPMPILSVEALPLRVVLIDEHTDIVSNFK